MLEQESGGLPASSEGTRHHVVVDSGGRETRQTGRRLGGLFTTEIVETGIGIGVPTRRRPTVSDQVDTNHQNHPGAAPPGRPGSMNHSIPNAVANTSGGIWRKKL